MYLCLIKVKQPFLADLVDQQNNSITSLEVQNSTTLMRLYPFMKHVTLSLEGYNYPLTDSGPDGLENIFVYYNKK